MAALTLALAPDPTADAPPALPAFARDYLRNVPGRSPFGPPAAPLLPVIARRELREGIDKGSTTYRVALRLAAGWPCNGCGRVIGEEGCGACKVMGG